MSFIACFALKKIVIVIFAVIDVNQHYLYQ